MNKEQTPKGHGRLIILSEDAVKREQTPLRFSCQNWISEVGLSNATVAIIEADKAESEKGQPKQTDDSCLNFDFDKVKEILKYELRQIDEEIKLGIDLGDEVVGDYGAKGVVVGIDTYNGEVLLSLLMRNHKVPQLVKASGYKTKTGRHFPQITEVLKQMKGETDEK